MRGAGTQHLFTAVILAADRTPDDPVARAAKVCCKALTPVAGRAMVLRVLDALAESEAIGRPLLCGPPREAFDQNAALRNAVDSGRVEWLANEPTPSTSAGAALDKIPESRPVLITTADHALLNHRIVDHFCGEAQASGHDLLVALAPRDLVESAFPEAKRTVLRFRDGAYCTCNLFVFMTPRARAAARFWRQVESRRKRPWRVMSLLGWAAVLRYLFGRLTLDSALKQVSRQMKLDVGVVLMPYAEAAVDVDSVSDLALAERILGSQTRGSDIDEPPRPRP
jgi:GTP:adenosylcobinamide-phosphate guanylyltransferase